MDKITENENENKNYDSPPSEQSTSTKDITNEQIHFSSHLLNKRERCFYEYIFCAPNAVFIVYLCVGMLLMETKLHYQDIKVTHFKQFYFAYCIFYVHFWLHSVNIKP